MPPNKNKRSHEDSPGPRSKRRRLNEEGDEEEEKEREPVSKAATSKKASAYGGGGSVASQKPAELFRKDLISAMKLPDSEPLAPEDYLLITDAWRQEWERGVQVPVNDVSVRPVDKKEVSESPKSNGDFKIPKKFLHSMKDEIYQLGLHELTGMSQLSEQVVRYDLDDLDVSWLRQLNEQREEVGDAQIHEWIMERVIEALEIQCYGNMEIKKKTEIGLGIEYDEDIVCEICQSPESEDTNEMVFCDGCDICVHQACYGIQTVPEGSWLCRACALGIKPACILCPKIGGAMKSTRSGTKWAHVSCAIWIPEVTIGCVEKMEPVTKISQIPASRWALICCICKERNGACIQCSVKACKTAFHVTCAVNDKLEMKTVLIEDRNTEDVKLKAYCPKHSHKRDRHGSESDSDSPRKSGSGSPIKESLSAEEMATLRAERLQKLEDEFYHLVRVSDIAHQLTLTNEVVDHIYVYWKLKRRSMFNRPLLTPKTEEADLLEKQQEDSLMARMKMFVHLRQDLERVRNLSYMISRREKMKRQFNAARETVFYATLEVLTDKKLNLSTREVEKIVKTYRDVPAPYGANDDSIKVQKLAAASVNSSKRSSTSSDKDMNTKRKSSDSGLVKRRPSLDEASNNKLLADDVSKRKSATGTGSEITKHRLSTESSDSSKTDKSDAMPKKRLFQTGDDVLTPKSRARVKSKNSSNGSSSDVKGDGVSKGAGFDAKHSSMDIDVESLDGTAVNSLTPRADGKKHTVQSRKSTSDSTVRADDKKHRLHASSDTISAQSSQSSSKSSVKKTEKLTPLQKEVRKVGRPRKFIKTDGDLSIGGGQISGAVPSDSKKALAAAGKSRTRSSLPEFVDIDQDDKIGLKVKSEFSESATSREQCNVDSKTILKETRSCTIKERRFSDFKLTEKEKEELVQKYPSAKNVSDHIKTELTGLLRNNKLVVSNKLRKKVQTALLNGKLRTRLESSIIIDDTQQKIDTFFKKSSPDCDPESHKSPGKNVSRVLNELSPMRDRLEANNIERTNILRSGHRRGSAQHSPAISEKSFDGRSAGSPSSVRTRSDSISVAAVREKLFDDDNRRITRSRESTPESTTSSYKSNPFENPRMKTRSVTPSSAGKDSDSELENIYETKRSRKW